MLRQTSILDAQAALHLQVETDQAALSQDVAPQRSNRFLWTGLGLAILMLIGLFSASDSCLTRTRPVDAVASVARRKWHMSRRSVQATREENRNGSTFRKRHLRFERLVSLAALQSSAAFALGVGFPRHGLPLQSDTTSAKVANLPTRRHRDITAKSLGPPGDLKGDRQGIPGSILDQYRHIDPLQTPIDHLFEEIPDWVHSNTRRQEVHFAELNASIPILEATDPSLELLWNHFEDDLVTTKDEGVMAGAELWPASFVVAKSVLRLLKNDNELLQVALRGSSAMTPSTMGQGKRVIEVNCGVGLPSLAALRAGATVTSTDHSPVPLDLVTKSAKLQPDGAAQRHHVVYLDLFNSQTTLDLLAEIQPDIVVASEVDWGDARLARAVGRFMGAAAARGAGVIASMDGTGQDSGNGWEVFFKGFNDAVYDFQQHASSTTRFHEPLFDTDMASFGRIRDEPIPPSIVDNTHAPGLLAKFFGQSAAIFEMDIGALDTGDPEDGDGW